MPSLFSRLKGKDGKSKSKKGANNDQLSQLPAKPKWTDAYARTVIEPEEIQELIRRCTEELKARGTAPRSPYPLNGITCLHARCAP
jgi:hypothetical protein